MFTPLAQKQRWSSVYSADCSVYSAHSVYSALNKLNSEVLGRDQAAVLFGICLSILKLGGGLEGLEA